MLHYTALSILYYYVFNHKIIYNRGDWGYLIPHQKIYQNQLTEL